MATTFASATRPATWAGTNRPVTPSSGAGDSSRLQTGSPNNPATNQSRSGGGGSSGRRGGGGSPETSVIVKPIGNGAEVLINGVGFSVAPGQLSNFLSSRGLSGSSYQSALSQAQKLDQQVKQQAEQKAKQQEQARRIQEQRAVTQRLLNQAGIQQKQSALLSSINRNQSRENYFENRQIGTYKGVPVNRVFEVNPNTGQVKPITKEQESILRNQPKELVAGNRNRIQEAVNTYLPIKTPIIIKRGATALGNIAVSQVKSLGSGYLKGQFLLDDLKQRGLTKYLVPDSRALSLSKIITKTDNTTYQLLKRKYGEKQANKFREQSLSNKLRNEMYSNLIYKDPDLQNLAITTGLGALGAGGKTSQAVAKWILRTMGTKQAYETYKNPTDENIVALGLFATPEIYRGIKSAKTRKDIMIADTGELVPLQNRLSQVDKIIKNQGRNIETVTAKATKKAGFTNVGKNNIDYTYGKNIQFGTYKVGDIFPTSKYFLTGKSNKSQKIFKRGVVQITDVKVQSNAKSLLSQIRKDLLKNGRTSESNIRKLYELAQREADATGRQIATISPKRLRGFWQAEQEIVKVIPKKYKPQIRKSSEIQVLLADRKYLGGVNGRFAKGKIYIADDLNKLDRNAVIKHEVGHYINKDNMPVVSDLRGFYRSINGKEIKKLKIEAYKEALKDLKKFKHISENEKISMAKDRANEYISSLKKYYPFREWGMEAGAELTRVNPKKIFKINEKKGVVEFFVKENPKKLNFGGWTDTGHRIYTDKGGFRNMKDFLKSKLNVKNKELSYWAKVAEDKYQYLRGKLNIKGEYAQHGRGHLNPMAKYNKYYSYHDITKVGDVDSFAKFEHGQAAYDLWKSGKFPDKSIYRLPKNIQKKIAQAYAMHTEARFNIKSILNKRSLTDSHNSVLGNVKGYIQQKRNPYLQDVATLDRLDLTRFPSVVGKLDYRMLSKDALVRLFGSEKNAIRKNLWKFDRSTIPQKLLNEAFSNSKKLNSVLIKQKNTFLRNQPRLKILDKIKSPSNQIKNSFNKLKAGKLSKVEAIKLTNEISRKLGKKYTLNSLKRDTSQYFRKVNQNNKLKQRYSKKAEKYISKKYAKINVYPYAIKNYKGKTYPKSYQKSYPKQEVIPYSNVPYKNGYNQIPRQPTPYKPSTPYRPSIPYKPSKPYNPVTPRKLKNNNFRVGINTPSKKRIEIKKKGDYFDVFARPSKSLSGRKTNKFIKVNQTPLDETSARDLRNYIADTSLSRSSLITPSVNKPGRVNLRFPRGYAAKTKGKFRDYRIVKGKRIPLLKGRVIELSRNALDTIQEKKRIDLFKRIKQIQIKPRKIAFIGKIPPRRKSQGINRPNLIKGSLEARNYMAKLRKMRR